MLGSSAIYLKEIKASRCRLTPQREAVLLAFLREKTFHGEHREKDRFFNHGVLVPVLRLLRQVPGKRGQQVRQMA